MEKVTQKKSTKGDSKAKKSTGVRKADTPKAGSRKKKTPSPEVESKPEKKSSPPKKMTYLKNGYERDDGTGCRQVAFNHNDLSVVPILMKGRTFTSQVQPNLMALIVRLDWDEKGNSRVSLNGVVVWERKDVERLSERVKTLFEQKKFIFAKRERTFLHSRHFSLVLMNQLMKRHPWLEGFLNGESSKLPEEALDQAKDFTPRRPRSEVSNVLDDKLSSISLDETAASPTEASEEPSEMAEEAEPDHEEAPEVAVEAEKAS